MTHAEAAEPSRLLVDRRERTAPRRSRRERLVDWPGHSVYTPPAGRDVGFLDPAPELAETIRSGCAQFTHVALADGSRATRPDRTSATLQREYPGPACGVERESGATERWY